MGFNEWYDVAKGGGRIIALVRSFLFINSTIFRTVYKKQEACEEEAVCMWKQGACMQNRDVHNNVCNPPDVKINPVCNAITKGICPIQWQVMSEFWILKGL